MLTQTNGCLQHFRIPKKSSGYAKAMHTWSMEQQTFWQKMQQSQNTWMEEEQDKCLEKRREALVKVCRGKLTLK